MPEGTPPELNAPAAPSTPANQRETKPPGLSAETAAALREEGYVIAHQSVVDAGRAALAVASPTVPGEPDNYEDDHPENWRSEGGGGETVRMMAGNVEVVSRAVPPTVPGEPPRRRKRCEGVVEPVSINRTDAAPPTPPLIVDDEPAPQETIREDGSVEVVDVASRSITVYPPDPLVAEGIVSGMNLDKALRLQRVVLNAANAAGVDPGLEEWTAFDWQRICDAIAKQIDQSVTTIDADFEDPTWTKNPAYEPKTELDKFGYLIEECGETVAAVGELLAALGKTLRWGLESTNPTLPPEQQETNRDWIIRSMPAIAREIPDLRKAMAILKALLLTAPEARRS